MKSIKIISAICFFISLMETSCSNNDDNKKQEPLISYEELHKDAKTFISEHFNDFIISKIKTKPHNTNEYYKVYFTEPLKIEFNIDGVWVEVDGNHYPIPTSFIKPTIMDYLNTNYPSVQVESIDKKWYGFKVKLLNRTELKFDQEGNFSGVNY